MEWSDVTFPKIAETLFDCWKHSPPVQYSEVTRVFALGPTEQQNIISKKLLEARDTRNSPDAKSIFSYRNYAYVKNSLGEACSNLHRCLDTYRGVYSRSRPRRSSCMYESVHYYGFRWLA